jgi:hypothetical protein
MYQIDRVRYRTEKFPAYGHTLAAMNPEERQQTNSLCERIQVEENSQAFMNLVEQLNELLERKEKRLAAVAARDATDYHRLMAAELNENIEATSASITDPEKSFNSRLGKGPKGR